MTLPEPGNIVETLPDGRQWHRLDTFGSRVDEAEWNGHEIDTIGAFMLFDTHETTMFLSLRTAEGVPILTVHVQTDAVWEARGYEGRPPTSEEKALADEAAARHGIDWLAENGLTLLRP